MAPGLSDFQGKISRKNVHPFAADHRKFSGTSQFTNLSGPLVAHECNASSILPCYAKYSFKAIALNDNSVCIDTAMAIGGFCLLQLSSDFSLFRYLRKPSHHSMPCDF